MKKRIEVWDDHLATALPNRGASVGETVETNRGGATDGEIRFSKNLFVGSMAHGYPCRTTDEEGKTIKKWIPKRDGV